MAKLGQIDPINYRPMFQSVAQSENFHFLMVKFSVYLNRLVFVMVIGRLPVRKQAYSNILKCILMYLFS